MPPRSPTLVWFRNDLRLADNPALAAAVKRGGDVVCFYIFEDGAPGQRPLGGASKWWLHQSLTLLSRDIDARGGRLLLRRGHPGEIIPDLVKETGAEAVFWNRRYSLPERDLDGAIKTALQDRELTAESFNGSLLTEPWSRQTKTGGYYRVFTPYWKAVRANYTPPEPLPAPDTLASGDVQSDDLESWGLTPASPDWAETFTDHWTPGEAGAHERLNTFIDGPINAYGDARNRPDLPTSTSGLSPHHRWGEISPVQIWRAVKARMDSGALANEDAAWIFLSEVVWREFSYVLLFHNPALADENYNRDFAHMPWRDSEDDYQRWYRGQTGYPIVDAGMRQLWQTGWMHNRVRMVVASFLTKHLLLPWQLGEDWFWDTLLDADPAANAASWQWVAGSGADAAPYFRVFNPITQGEKFDETGDYVRRWCPELAKLPNKYLFSPWDAPKAILLNAGIVLGETYPTPIIEHKAGRQRALDAYDTLKERRSAA